MGPWHRRTVTVVALAAATVPMVGCAEPVDGPVLVLTLASPDPVTEPNGPSIQLFVQEVQRRSSGTIRIEPVWDITQEGVDDWDQVVAKAVADGTYDLGLVPSRAWDVLGVTTLRALNTPFLVDSDAAMRAVLSSNLRSGLLAGLPVAGVAGIDLWPSEMRRLFGYHDPVVRPADLVGEKVRSPTSKTVTALLEAMGATVVQDKRSPRTQRGQESSFSTSGVGDLVATGNVVLFPKVESLVADEELRSRLQPAQWQILLEAAAATRREQLDSFPDDVEWAREFCRRGDEIVAASPGDLAAFEDVGRQIRSDLERDPGTASLIKEIENLVATVPEKAPIAECPADVAEPAAQGDDETSALDGVYVTRVTRRDMLEAGVTDPDLIRENTGRITWTLDGGYWHHVIRSNHYVSDNEAAGTYTFKDARFTLHWGPEEVITARLDIAPDGSIRFRELHDNLPELQQPTEGFFGQPWRRVGDLPD